MKVLNTPNPMITGLNTTFVVAGGTSPYTLELITGNGSIAGQVYSPGSFIGAASFRITDAKGQAIHMSTHVIDDPTR